MATILSTFTEVLLADTRTRAGTIVLPPLSQIPYRMLTFKDVYGTFSNSTLTLSTQAGNTFEDSTTTVVLSNAYSFYNLYAASTKWLVLDGTQTLVQSISTLNVNSLNIGNGVGWIQLGPIQTVAVSTTQVNVQNLYANCNYFGSISSQTALYFYGLQGNYNNTVIAEQSTGTGRQELLLFKGSSPADQVRFQTTGSIVFEPGAPGRLWPTYGQLSTPTMILNSSLNVGIRVSSPQTTLDVGGTGRFQTVSTLALFLSSVNGSALLTNVDSQLASTVAGLGAAGYISSSQLTSTVSGLYNFVSSFVDTVELTSTVAGLGSAGYISTSQLTSTISGLYDFVSSFVDTKELVSTVEGLGNSYLSSLPPYISAITMSTGTIEVSSIVLLDSLNPTQNKGFILNTGAEIQYRAPGTHTFLNADATNTEGLIAKNFTILEGNSLNYAYQFGAGSAFTNSISSPTLLNIVAGTVAPLYISSLFFGSYGGTVYGELTTNDTATDIFWNGSSLITAGGGVTTAELVSTVSSFENRITSQQVSTGFVELSTLNMIDGFTNDVNFLTVSSGTLLLNGGFITGSGGSAVTQIIAGTNISVSPGGGTGVVTINNTINPSGLVSTPNLIGLLSTGSILGLISTQNLDNLVSTSFLDTTIVSTVEGLGNTYLSTLPPYLSAFTVSTGSLELSSLILLNIFDASINNASIYNTGSGLILEAPGKYTFLETGGTQTAGLIAKGYSLLDGIATDYNYDLAAGSLYTGTVSAPTMVNGFLGILAPMYLSSLFLGSYGGATFGELTTDSNGLEPYWNGSTLLMSPALLSTTSGLETSFIGQQMRVSSLYVNLDPDTAPPWDSNTPAAGFDPEPNPLAVDIFGSVRFLKNVYIGSTTTKIGTGGIETRLIYTSTVTAESLVSTASLLASTLTLMDINTSQEQLVAVSSGVLTLNGQGIAGGGGDVTSADLISTFAGIQKSLATEQVSSGFVELSTLNMIDGFTNALNYLTVSSGTLLLNGGFITGSGGTAVTQILAGTNISVSPAGGTGIVTINNTINPTGLVSTANLSGLLSTGSILGFVSTPNLWKLVSTPFLDTSLVSTVEGLGTAGYATTAQLAGLISTANLENLVSTAFLDTSLTSTVEGLGTAGYATTAQLAGLISTANLENLVSTAFLDTSLTSTVEGLGTAGYATTAQLAGLISTANLENLVSTAFLDTSLVSTVEGLGTAGYATTAQLAGLISTANLENLVSTAFLDTSLVSTVEGLGTAGYATTAQLAGLISTANLENLVSTAFLDTSLVSTVEGLGTAGYATTAQLAGLISTANLENLVSTAFLDTSLVSTVEGLGTAGYATTAQLAGLISTANLENLVSTAFLDTSLTSTVEGLGTAGYATTAQLEGLISTPNLWQLVSTSYLETQLVSTIAGLNYVAVTEIIAGTNISISPIPGIGAVTINATASGSGVIDTEIASTLQKSEVFSTIAIGYNAGITTQGLEAIAIGISTGNTSQGASGIAIGNNAANTSQQPEGIAIGYYAGYQNQGNRAIGIGTGAGFNLQSLNALAIGYNAGYGSQGVNAVAIGKDAGNTNQGSNSVAIGTGAGTIVQGDYSIAIGFEAGKDSLPPSSIVINALGSTLNTAIQGFFVAPINYIQGSQTHTLGYNSNSAEIGLIDSGIGGGGSVIDTEIASTLKLSDSFSTIAIGTYAGSTLQQGFAIAIGWQAGASNQGTDSIAIGDIAGLLGQGATSIAIGSAAGYETQATNAIAIGNSAGYTGQGDYAIGIGYQGGNVGQQIKAVSIGYNAGQYIQQDSAIAIGNQAGSNNQGIAAIAIGSNAGFDTQANQAIAIGHEAGQSLQGGTAIAIGLYSGRASQGANAIGIGYEAGFNTQGANAIALGQNAGFQTQANNSIAIGTAAAQYIQQTYAIAIGDGAGFSNQQANTIAVGFRAGEIDQCGNSIAIGYAAGNSNQGEYSIAIGNNAGTDDQISSSIILNARLTKLDAAASGFFVAPVRDIEGEQTNTLAFNSVTNEIGYVNLVSASNWSLYPAISSIELNLADPRIINPVPETQFVIQTGNMFIQDAYGAPGYLNLNSLAFRQSTSLEEYTVVYDQVATGTVSSLALVYSDGSANFQTGSFYLSSIYLGGVGGSVFGQLTTDGTASDIYWNGTSLTAGGGGGITSNELISTTSGLQTNFIGQQVQLSTLYVNMNPDTAPFWDSNIPIGGSDPEPNPLAVDVFGSVRFLKNVYIGSTTTVLATSGIFTPQMSTGFAYISTQTGVNIQPSQTNLWIAAGTGGSPNETLKYSSDGLNWSNADSGGFDTVGLNAAWNGNMWLAGGVDTLFRNIKYSYDGRNWSNASSEFFDTGVAGIAWNGNLWVAVGIDATQNIKYSYDGINWLNTPGIRFTDIGNKVAWNGSMWVAVGKDSASNDTIKYSYDGINWSNSAGPGFVTEGRGIAWGGNMWVAVGNDSTSNNTIKYSYDGINWSNSAGSGFATGIGSADGGYGVSWNGRMWVAVGFGASPIECIKYSYDGINWSNSSGIGFSDLGNSVTWNGNMWIAVGSDTNPTNLILYSYDGITWAPTNGLNFTVAGYGIAYSSNVTPAYKQENLQFLPQNIPITLTSTNTFLAQPSSLVINNTLSIDKTWNYVGINCNIPQYSLDVNGTLNVTTLLINGQNFDGQFASTIEGLGTAGYVSSATLLSTVEGGLASTVRGLGTAGYVSTANILNFVSTVNFIGGIAFNNLSTNVISAATISANVFYASTVSLRQQFFTDLGTAAVGSPIFQSSTYLYFGGNIVAPARVAPIQTITF